MSSSNHCAGGPAQTVTHLPATRRPQVSTKILRAQSVCTGDHAMFSGLRTAIPGYLVGGTSAVGARKALPVYLERRYRRLVDDLHQRWQGFLVSIAPN